jgi:hypothetical protein
MSDHATVAAQVVARRLVNGGCMETVVSDVVRTLSARGCHAGVAAHLGTDAVQRLSADTELARYERLLATHDWTYEYSDDHSVWQRGRAERAVLQALAQQLDPEHKLWQEYAR